MAEKWKSLKHNGVLFPPDYNYRQYTIKVCGKETTLSKEAEELASAWAAKTETEYATDRTFQKNFWKDFKPLLPKELQDTKFPEDWNTSSIYADILNQRDARKERTKEDKEKEKEERELLSEKYGYATIDRKRTKLEGYMVEPPGLFMGRGKHPLRGRWKPRIYPENVTLNMSKSADIPPCPIDGSRWQQVVENKNALWTAMWIERLTGKQKRILFHQASHVRQESNIKKFDKAVELATNFDKVNALIKKKLRSKDPWTMQMATACNLIAKMCIRVGDEKGSDEADTVGCTSLRVEHVKIDGDVVHFNFLGKDSIRYKNSVTFCDNTIKNLNTLMKGKGKKDMIFNKITSRDVNSLFDQAISGLSAKQFRTATGSSLLATELKRRSVDPEAHVREKQRHFTEANLEVALKLNHQTAVSDAYDVALKKMQSDLKVLKEQMKVLRAESKPALEEAKEMRDRKIELAAKKKTKVKQREAVKRAKETYKKVDERWTNKINKLKEKIKNLEIKVELKKKTKGVALGTSKLNYADPRIITSWCSDVDFPVEKIYTSAVKEKFQWALDTEKSFYQEYPELQEV